MEQLISKTFIIRSRLARIDSFAIQVGSSLRNVFHRNGFDNQKHYSDSSSSRGGRGGGKRSPRATMLGQTEVFMQSGLKISELPLVVKKVNDVLQVDISPRHKSNSEPVPATIYIPNSKVDKFNKTLDGSDPTAKTHKESQEIIAGLRRCFSVGGLFRLLETIPADEVTADVAVAALKLIINLDNHPFSTTIPFHRQTLRGNRKTASIAKLTNKTANGESGVSETFLRYAFINMLLEIIYRSRDPKAIIEGKY